MKLPKRSCVGGALSLTTLSVFLFLPSQTQSVFANSAACCPLNAASRELNRGYLSTPRAREEFPWLTRNVTTLQIRAEAKTMVNRALANSPRYREEHPELLRPDGTYAFITRSIVPLEVTKNSALAASPRAREEFPALQRTSVSEISEQIQIAPLK